MIWCDGLTNDDFTPFQIVEGDPASGIVLLADHARNCVPEEYGSLGLPADQFERHIAFDIGVEALTRSLAERLGCPAVHSCFSRLLIDPNRGEDDPTLVMRLSDGTVIPGNHPITKEEIQNRIDRFHEPYHAAIDHQLDACIATGKNPLVLSVHSYTPFWKGVARPWHGAILWDNDPRLNHFMLDGLRQHKELTIGDNEPYDGALKNDTVYRHCTQRGLAYSLIEVRQDLIADGDGVAQWADYIAPLLEAANRLPDMHKIEKFGSRADGTAK